MPVATDRAVSSKGLWAGRIISGLIVLFMLFDATVKLLRLPAALEGTVRLGYPASVVVPIGVVGLACIVFYLIPRTAVLGAVLLTGTSVEPPRLKYVSRIPGLYSPYFWGSWPGRGFIYAMRKFFGPRGRQWSIQSSIH